MHFRYTVAAHLAAAKSGQSVNLVNLFSKVSVRVRCGKPRTPGTKKGDSLVGTALFLFRSTAGKATCPVGDAPGISAEDCCDSRR